MLQSIEIKNFILSSGKAQDFCLSYESFGRKIGSAPIILVNHALTGNSSVTGANGWWKNIIGENKIIDTLKYSVLAFNIPGNGYDDVFIDNYEDITTKDIANLFLRGLEILKINKLHSIIGGSLGGAIGWEMAYISPKICDNLIPIATDNIATDWIISHCYLQELILKNSENPLHDARVHAMLLYRTPSSINQRFRRETKEDSVIYKSEDWLDYHGRALSERFKLKAYRLMNHLIKSIHTTNNEECLTKIKSNIHIIGVNSDLFFTAERNRETFEALKSKKENTYYYEIKSAHGHDAFLIEYEQLKNILKPIFNSTY